MVLVPDGSRVLYRAKVGATFFLPCLLTELGLIGLVKSDVDYLLDRVTTVIREWRLSTLGLLQ